MAGICRPQHHQYLKERRESVREATILRSEEEKLAGDLRSAVDRGDFTEASKLRTELQLVKDRRRILNRVAGIY